MLHRLLLEARRTLFPLATGKVEEAEEKKGERERTMQGGDAEDDVAALPRVPWSKIEDRHGESGLEYSFLSDEDSQAWIKCEEGWVRQQIAFQIPSTNVSKHEVPFISKL